MDYILGQYLKKLRGKMSLREAASRSGLSFAYIRDLEVGVNRSNNSRIHPSPETLRKLSEAYNSSFEDLMLQAGYTTFNTTRIELTNNPSDEHPDLIRLLKTEAKISVGSHYLSPTDKLKLMDILETLFLKYK